MSGVDDEYAMTRLCGCAPDCGERIMCETPGAVGHFQCGWCETDDLPRHKCGHTVTEVQP